ncbi:MAG: alpha/beta hydrolase [Bryobacterales bacterium]
MSARTLALVFLLACAPVFAEAPPELPAGWSDGWTLANGIRIHYYRAPAPGKPVLILAHGSSDDGRCWTSLARELEGRYDMYLVDARGHGLTDAVREGDAADAQVEDLAGFIREMRFDKPILMGHSMGASSSAWLAAKYPDLLSAVILEDPGLLPRNYGASSAADVEQRRRETLERNNMTFDAMVARCMENTPIWGYEECRLWAPSKLLHHPNNAYRRFGDRPSMEELFDKTTIPTLILKADAPPDVRKQNVAVAKHLAKGKIVHIDGAGHNVRRERKAQLMVALNAFLASL